VVRLPSKIFLRIFRCRFCPCISSAYSGQVFWPVIPALESRAIFRVALGQRQVHSLLRATKAQARRGIQPTPGHSVGQVNAVVRPDSLKFHTSFRSVTSTVYPTGVTAMPTQITTSDGGLIRG
jgi:hypothetical protein